MVLGAGSKVGPYEILGALGAGGMGEVYRGRDPKLNRTIAIKVLSGEYSRDAGRLARFEQEARAASALNHPNIVTIYDVGQSDGTAYIAMEFVDGRTLREALEGGALPLKKALGIAAQAADGLAKAHQAGLVHRDLKPENVMVTGDGLVKILDFGLVKLVTPGSGEPVGATATAVVPATHPGMVLGTVGYMSPEQARGREVDFRSDQFSLGTLLYEMLTGKRPFHRESSAQTMAAIIEDEPRPVSEVNPKVPAPVRWIVERCLAKEPEERYASTRDLARDLQRVRDHLSEASTSSQFGAVTAAAPAPSRSKRRMWATGAAGVAGLLLGLAIGRTMRRGETQPTALRTLTFSGSDLQPSVSRDGRMVAFTSLRDGKSRIWVKQLPGAGEAPITSGPNDGNARFSPDGTMLLFIRRESGVSWVCRTAVVGGETKKVIRGEWADWSPDGKQIGVLQRDTDPAQDTTSVLVSDVDGGHAKTLQRVSGELLSGLRWSPDGNWLAMVTRHFGLTAEGEKIVLVSGDGKERKQIDPLAGGDTSNVAWIGPEELVYARARQTTGSGLSNLQTPTSVVRQNVRTGERRILLWVPNAVIDVEAVPGGGIIFDVMSGGENVRETVMRGGRADPNQEKMLTRGNSNDRQPVYGSDDEWLAFSSNRTNNLDVWAVSSKSGEVRRLTDDPTDDWDPAFTADGKQLVWSAHRSGNYEIWMADADGSGAHQVTHDGVDAENPIPTVDGWIVYNSGNPAHRGIRKIRVDGTQDQAVPGVVGDWPEVSRDGQYVMVVVHGPSASHLAIHRLSDGGLVMTVPLMTPLAGRSYWMPDGKTILYDDSVSADTGFPNTRGSVYAQDFIPGKDTSATRRPVLDWLKQGGVETFAVSHDGERIAYAVVEMSTSLMEAEGIEDK